MTPPGNDLAEQSPPLQASPRSRCHASTSDDLTSTIAREAGRLYRWREKFWGRFEYVGLGLTIVQVDSRPIKVAQNLVPGGWGGNYLTGANVNSPPNAISSSIGRYTASGSVPDNFDFVFDPMVSAAGLFVGNLGTCENLPITVQFLDDIDQVIAEAAPGQDTPGVIFGSATGAACGDLSPVPFDNRIFYGVISAVAQIKTMRVLNGPGGITDPSRRVVAPLSYRDNE